MTLLIDVPLPIAAPRKAAPFPPPRQAEVRPELIDAMIDLFPGDLLWRRTFRGTVDQIPQVRHFVRHLLADSPHRDQAELIVSELAANAVRHTNSGDPQGTFIVEVRRTSEATTVSVYDNGWGGTPSFGRHCPVTAQSGRGLLIVAAIADQVGYDGDDERGHRVWATLTSTPRGRLEGRLN